MVTDLAPPISHAGLTAPRLAVCIAGNQPARTARILRRVACAPELPWHAYRRIEHSQSPGRSGPDHGSAISAKHNAPMTASSGSKRLVVLGCTDIGEQHLDCGGAGQHGQRVSIQNSNHSAAERLSACRHQREPQNQQHNGFHRIGALLLVAILE